MPDVVDQCVDPAALERGGGERLHPLGRGKVRPHHGQIITLLRHARARARDDDVPILSQAFDDRRADSLRPAADDGHPVAHYCLLVRDRSLPYAAVRYHGSERSTIWGTVRTWHGLGSST